MGDVPVRPGARPGRAPVAVVVALAAGIHAHAAADARPGDAAPGARPGAGPGAGDDTGEAREARAGATPAASPTDALDAVASVITDRGGAAWRPLPAVAAGAREAAAAVAGEAVDVRAWGDAWQGCFVLVARMRGGGAGLHRALREALERPEPGPAAPADAAGAGAARAAVITDGWELHEADARVDSGFTVATGDLRGQVRVVSRGADPAATTWATACVYSAAREPGRSARACARLLPAIARALHIDPEESP